MQAALIIDAVRTPIGSLGGRLASVRADDLAAHVIRALLHRTGIDPTSVEEVYLGCANQAGEDNRNVARMAALLAGVPASVPAATVNRLCASGMTAVNMAARAIASGNGEIYIAGGVESMSRAPYSIPKAGHPYSFGNLTAWDTALGWRYPNPLLKAAYGNESMGETAENIATERPHITRELQDAFALRSHQKAIQAIDSNRFVDEIAPVPTEPQHGTKQVFSTDERPRRDTNAESLSKLQPAFRHEGGTVTAGNSSGLNDGAAALLIMSEARARALGLQPLARIVSSAAAGVAPRVMGLGPTPATRLALIRAGLSMDQIAIAELNEAFAVQALAVIEDLHLDPIAVNVNGGAIALGHPLGCTGARLITTLVHELRHRRVSGGKDRFGLATLCVGVGQGESTVVEALS